MCSSTSRISTINSDSSSFCSGIQARIGNEGTKGKGALITGIVNCSDEPAVLTWCLCMKTRLCLLFPSDLPTEKLVNK